MHPVMPNGPDEVCSQENEPDACASGSLLSLRGRDHFISTSLFTALI